MLDSELLENYMQNFYGYGNWKSDIWFIGIEECGGEDEDKVRRRLESWKSIRQENGLINIYEHHQNIGQAHYLDEGTMQPTWRKPIKIMLSYQNQSFNDENINNFQCKKLGRENNVISNLLPLPCRSIEEKDWKYSQYSDTNYFLYLESRTMYISKVAQYRVQFFRKKLERYKPKHVIMYGKKLERYWDELVGVKIKDKYKKRYTI